MKRSDPLDMEVTARPVAPAMSRTERLERWARLLEEYEGRIVPLPGIEYMTPERRRELTGPSYPMTVAFADPVFRSMGLPSDRLGDSLDFFGLTEDDAHHLMCECVSTGAMIPHRLRHYARTGRHAGFWTQARSLLRR